MQQFENFNIVHVEGRHNECADSLSRLHLYNLMMPKHDNLSDEEARMAEAGEGGDERQATALRGYSVQEVTFDAGKQRAFIQHMDSTLHASYLNAFTKNEIVIVSCLLAFPGLSFTNIRQKRAKSLWGQCRFELGL